MPDSAAIAWKGCCRCSCCRCSYFGSTAAGVASDDASGAEDASGVDDASVDDASAAGVSSRAAGADASVAEEFFDGSEPTWAAFSSSGAASSSVGFSACTIEACSSSWYDASSGTFTPDDICTATAGGGPSNESAGEAPTYTKSAGNVE